MIACPNCAHLNREGLLFCEVCGDSLVAAAYTVAATRRLEMSPAEPVVRVTWGTTPFTSESTVVFQVNDGSKPIELSRAAQIIIGRGDPASGLQPELDLTLYGGLDRGVSRIHAEISRSDEALMIIDRGSVNGTHLNGERLIPNEPHMLRDGDEIRLGNLVAHIYFR